MRLLILSNLLSSHTIKWAKALSEMNEVLVFSFSAPDPETINDLKGINYQTIDIRDPKPYRNYSFKKIAYFKAVSEVKKIINDFKPDILHAHYGTSYGLIGAMSGFHPFILSVWGSDVYDFPLRSVFHRMLLRYNLKKADIILSTSHAMAHQTSKFTDKNILVTPFGIDLNKFCKNRVTAKSNNDEIVIGTVKTLYKTYGIIYLIRAFKIVADRNPGRKLKLLIVGGGPLENDLKKLAKEIKIDAFTTFTGYVPSDKVPEYLNMLDIYVAVSIHESFGVAVIEAGACELPVVVSNVGGLKEVVEEGKTGYVVPSENSAETANAIEKLVYSEAKRNEFGKNARLRISEHYDWVKNVELMNSIYLNCLVKR